MMLTDRFAVRVGSVDELTALMGTPSPIAVRKERAALDEHMRRFIAHSPFAILSTCGSDGRCDASPRGDAPGFVQVLDDQTLLIPDRPGNRRLDSFRNIVETGRVGLLFLVPGMGETLRINGQAILIRDEEWLTPLSANGKRPSLAVAVQIEECFLQCAKALIRSRLWDTPVRPSLEALPSAAEMLCDQVQLPEYDVSKMQTLLDSSYANNLY